MTNVEITELKSRYNALIVGAKAGLQEAAEIRKALAQGTGKNWHVQGPGFAALNAVAEAVEALPSYGKGAEFEKRPGEKLARAPRAVAPVRNDQRRYF